MVEIKAKYINKEIGMIEAAKALTAHNGNPFAGNMAIVRRWK